MYRKGPKIRIEDFKANLLGVRFYGGPGKRTPSDMSARRGDFRNRIHALNNPELEQAG